MSEPVAILVREAEAADASHVAGLIRQLREQGEAMPAEAPSQGYVAAYLEQTTDIVFVADSGGAAVGLLTLSVHADLYHEAPCAEIRELVVDGAMHGRGIGGALLDAAIERARSLSCAEISLATGFENEQAQALYRSRGLTMEALHLERHLDDGAGD